MKNKDFHELKQYLNFKTSEIELYIRKIQEMADSKIMTVKESFNMNISDIEKKLKKKVKDYFNTKSMNIEEIRSLMIGKADKVDIMNLEKLKAEKIDLKLTENMNELHQKQMQHMIIIIIEIIKSSGKMGDKNSQTNSTLKYLFRQALTVYSWMKGKGKK